MNNLSDYITVTRRPVNYDEIQRKLRIKKEVIINNVSGAKAYIIISPTQVLHLMKIKLNKLGELEFNHDGEIKCQCSPLLNNSKRLFELDTTSFYLTVFYKSGEQWKKHFQDNKFDSSSYDINLLPRHVEEAENIVF
jgi:hypothetical protein